MKIKSILTRRHITNYSSIQIVYEWEDIFAKSLGVGLFKDDDRRRSRVCKYLPFLKRLFLPSPSLNTFVFEMAWRDHRGLNSKNMIPLIIDFFSRNQQELDSFYKSFQENPVVFVSSLEVYDFLQSKNCPLNIAHLGLSLSDKYKITSDTVFEKKYDLVMMGRQNRVLERFAQQYAESHSDFTYVYQKKENGNISNMDQSGRILGNVNSREDYIRFMSLGRTMLYSTPDIDTDSRRSHGFNQVTPRFLEGIATGCHVIARYPQNSDVEYYELDRMVLANVKDYEAFEKAMDYARSNDVDMKKYSEYLAKHYTSVRVKELQTILDKIK